MQIAPVSVIIPTYNRPAKTREAVLSVFQQRLPVTEVIVVDDGSGQHWQHTGITHPYTELIRIHSTENHGVSHARNRGITHARSPWIALLDSDDLWHPDKIFRQWHALQEQPHYRVCHSDELWVRNGKRINPARKHRKPQGMVFEACLPLCALSPSSIMMHRSVLERTGLFDTELPACEDYDLWLRIACRYSVLLVDAPLLTKHGGHDDQLSRHYPAMDRFRIHSMNRLLHHAPLSELMQQQTRNMLFSKAKIYGAGLVKREKKAELKTLNDLLTQHQMPPI